MEYHSAIKKNEVLSFAAKWMDLEDIMLNEISQKEKDKYHTVSPVCGIKKNGTNELIYKTEIESQMQKTDLWLPGWEVVGGGGGGCVMNWEIRIDIFTLICIKWISNSNKNLLYKKISKIKFKN